MTSLGLTVSRADAGPVDAESTSRLLIPLVRLAEDTARPAEAPAEVLTPWRKLVEDSGEACLVLEPSGAVVAASSLAAELLGDYGADQVIGHHLLDVIDLVDFHGGAAGAVYADRLAPLLALAGDAMARGLLRVRIHGGGTRTLDAIAAPLHDDDGQVIGAIAFLAAIWT